MTDSQVLTQLLPKRLFLKPKNDMQEIMEDLYNLFGQKFITKIIPRCVIVQAG